MGDELFEKNAQWTGTAHQTTRVRRLVGSGIERDCNPNAHGPKASPTFASSRRGEVGGGRGSENRGHTQPSGRARLGFHAFNIQVNQGQSVLSAIPAPAWAVLGVVLGSLVTGVLALWQKRLDRVHTHSQWMNENRMKGQMGLDEDPRSLESSRHSAPAIQR